MVEQDAVRRMDAIGFAIVHRDPIGIELGGSIGRARIKGRRLALRHFLHQPVKLRRGSLVKARLLLQLQDADRLQQTQRADAIGVGGIFGCFETDLDMALRREIVDLVGLGFLHQPDEVGGVGQVAVMQEEVGVALVRVLVEMVNAAGVERRRPALDAMDDIALFEQQFGQIGPVLTGNPGNQRDF
jgi:hypothetical protein